MLPPPSLPFEELQTPSCQARQRFGGHSAPRSQAPRGGRSSGGVGRKGSARVTAEARVLDSSPRSSLFCLPEVSKHCTVLKTHRPRGYDHFLRPSVAHPQAGGIRLKEKGQICDVRCPIRKPGSEIPVSERTPIKR